MYSWNDILIVGDSFCAKRLTYDHWPKLLYCELTNDESREPRGEGYSGCAWWSVRKRLLDELEICIPKILIIIHTDYTRLINGRNAPINIGGTFNIIKHSRQKLKTSTYELYDAAAEYYKHLYSKNFHVWAQKRWFEELDEILEKHQIQKTIHLFINHDSNTFYRFKNGLTIKDKLARYLIKNFNSIEYDNHMTNERNQSLAYSLYNIINNEYITDQVYEKILMEGGNDNIKDF